MGAKAPVFIFETTKKRTIHTMNKIKIVNCIIDILEYFLWIIPEHYSVIKIITVIILSIIKIVKELLERKSTFLANGFFSGFKNQKISLSYFFDKLLGILQVSFWLLDSQNPILILLVCFSIANCIYKIRKA